MDKQLLRDVIVDQHSLERQHSLVSRTIFKKIEHYKQSKQIIIITGLRRCGKSVLMAQIRHEESEREYFINFDDDRLVNFQVEDFQSLYEIFIELYGVQKTFYFDEIQNILGWERFVRRLYEQGNKIYITGSNAAMLSKELGTRLTGRYLEINLYPYSFIEFLNFKGVQYPSGGPFTTIQKGTLKSSFNEFFSLGGLPEYLTSNLNEYLHTLYESIIYRDVVVRHNIHNHKALKELVYILASQVGKECTYNSLKKTLGLASATTVSDYCGFLEDCYLCFLVNRYDPSLRKQLQSPKKVYFIDQALATAVGFRFSQDHGRMLENIVFLELKRRGFEIYYHKGNRECDFVLREQGRIVSAIQVCDNLSQEKTYEREVDGLVEALQAYELSSGLIISQDIEKDLTITKGQKTYHIAFRTVWHWLIVKSF